MSVIITSGDEYYRPSKYIEIHNFNEFYYYVHIEHTTEFQT